MKRSFFIRIRLSLVLMVEDIKIVDTEVDLEMDRSIFFWLV